MRPYLSTKIRKKTQTLWKKEKINKYNFVCRLFVKTVNEMRVLISTSNFPVQIKSCASHLSCMCLYGGVYLASCSLWWRHKILFWFSSLIFQYHTCCSKGHFLCSIYLVRLMRFVFVFCFFLIAIVRLSILRNFMSLFSHFVGDYLSISATIRRILNSEDNKWRILFCCSFTWIPVQYFTFKWNDTFSDCDWSISNQR